MKTAPSVSGYSLAFATPLAGWFALFFLAPLAVLVAISFYADPLLSHVGFDQYKKIATDGFSLPVLADTLWLGVQVTLLCQADRGVRVRPVSRSGCWGISILQLAAAAARRSWVKRVAANRRWKSWPSSSGGLK